MQHQGGAKNFAVSAQVEGFRLQYIGNAADGVRVEQDAAQNRFLRLKILGRIESGRASKFGS